MMPQEAGHALAEAVRAYGPKCEEHGTDWHSPARTELEGRDGWHCIECQFQRAMFDALAAWDAAQSDGQVGDTDG